MAAFSISSTGKKVTITNTSTSKQVNVKETSFISPTLVANTDYSAETVPAMTIYVPSFKTLAKTAIKPGDSVDFVTTNVDEIMYYEKLASKPLADCTVVLADVETVLADVETNA